MVEVVFNERKNGACPLCKRYEHCEIINAMKKACESKVRPRHDDKMEIVVYRCPEFVEAMVTV